MEASQGELETEQNFGNVELKRLQKLSERYEDSVGKVAIVEVPDSGFVLQFEKQRPMAGNDWLLADLDDTLVAYSTSKEKRHALFNEYIKNRGMSLSDAQSERLMELSDKFSRWKSNDKSGDQYHADAHMTSLQWAVNIVEKSDRPVDETIDQIEENLKIIKENPQEMTNFGDIPFFIRQNDRKFVVRGGNIWSKNLENVFTESMFKPERYADAIQAMKETSGPKDSIHRTNLGLFTYGDPYFQTSKILELMQEHPDLPVSQIWLTKVPKGEFIKKLAETQTNRNLEQDYVPPELEDTEGEGLAYGSGYALGQSEHVIVMFDDSPKELASILDSNQYLKDKTGASFVVVRSRRQETKEGKKDWTVDTKYGEVNFSTNEYSPSEISNIFLVNRYLGLRTRLGEQNSRVISAYNELIRRGMTVE